MEQVKRMREDVAATVKSTNETIAKRDAELARATQVTEELKVVIIGKDQALDQASEEIRKRDEEIARLQRKSLMVPDGNVVVTDSNVATINDVARDDSETILSYKTLNQDIVETMARTAPITISTSSKRRAGPAGRLSASL